LTSSVTDKHTQIFSFERSLFILAYSLTLMLQ